MRPFLSLLVWTRSLMLNSVGCFTQTPVGTNRKHRDVSTGVVGHQYKSCRGINDYVTGRAAKRGALIQRRKITGVPIYGKCAQRARRLSFEFCRFIYRIQEATLSVDREKRWFGYSLNGI